jgi:hypothetical protein
VEQMLVDSESNESRDRLIVAGREFGHLEVRGLNLKFALQTYLRSTLTELGHALGTWFDDAYMLQYLKARIDNSRFKVEGEINDPVAKYDADVIIYDKLVDIFYFCQVKHRAEVIHPFLRDELNEFGRNKAFQKGIVQLKTLRSLIDTPGVRERVVGRIGKKLVGTGSLAARSRFLLIHTVENFDMCTVDGIAMYEWNTFRNLLQGLMHYGRGNTLSESTYDTLSLDFSNIQEVQSHLMSSTDQLYEAHGYGEATPSKHYAHTKDTEVALTCKNALWLNDRPILRTGFTSVRAPLL